MKVVIFLLVAMYVCMITCCVMSEQNKINKLDILEKILITMKDVKFGR